MVLDAKVDETLETLRDQMAEARSRIAESHRKVAGIDKRWHRNCFSNPMPKKIWLAKKALSQWFCGVVVYHISAFEAFARRYEC